MKERRKEGRKKGWPEGKMSLIEQTNMETLATKKTILNFSRKESVFVRSAQRGALCEIEVDTMVSTLTRRGRH